MQFIKDDCGYVVNVSAALAFWKEEMCDDCSDSWDIKFLMPDNKEVTLCFDTIERRDAAFAKLVAKDKPVEDVKVAPAALKFEDITFHDVITCLKKIGFLDVCIVSHKSEPWAEVLVFQLKSTPGTHDFDHRFEYPVPRTIKDWQSLIRRICIRVTPIPIPYFSGNTLDYDFGYDLDLAEPPAPIDVPELAPTPFKFEDITDDYIIALLNRLGFSAVTISSHQLTKGLILPISYVKISAQSPLEVVTMTWRKPISIRSWQEFITELCTDGSLPVPQFIGDTLDYTHVNGTFQVVPPAPLKRTVLPLEGLDAEGIKSTCDHAANILEENLIKEGRLEEEPAPVEPLLTFDEIDNEEIEALLKKLGFTSVRISYRGSTFDVPDLFIQFRLEVGYRRVTGEYLARNAIRDWQAIICDLCAKTFTLPIPTFIGETLEYHYERVEKETPVPETRPLAPGLKFEDITFEYIESLLYKLGFHYITIYPYDDSGVAEDDVVFKLESPEDKHVWRYPLPKTIKEWQRIICEMCSNARDLPIPTFIGETLEYDYERAEKETPSLMPQTTSPTRGRSISPWEVPPPLKFEDIQAEHIIAILENLGFIVNDVCVLPTTAVYVSVNFKRDGIDEKYRQVYEGVQKVMDWQAIIRDVCRMADKQVPEFKGDTLIHTVNEKLANCTYEPVLDDNNEPILIFKNGEITPEHIVGVLESLGFTDVRVELPTHTLPMEVPQVFIAVLYKHEGHIWNSCTYHDVPDWVGDWQLIIKEVCKKVGRPVPQFNGWLEVDETKDTLSNKAALTDVPGLKFEDITHEDIHQIFTKLGFSNVCIITTKGGLAPIEISLYFKQDGEKKEYHQIYAGIQKVCGWQTIIKDVCINTKQPVPQFNSLDSLEYTLPTEENNFDVKFEDITDTHIAEILENLGFREVCVAELSGGAKNIYVSVDTENDGTSRNYRDYYATPKSILDWQTIIRDVCKRARRFIPQFIGDYTLCYIDKAKNKIDEEDIK